jgi:hypothetical protein
MIGNVHSGCCWWIVSDARLPHSRANCGVHDDDSTEIADSAHIMVDISDDTKTVPRSAEVTGVVRRDEEKGRIVAETLAPEGGEARRPTAAKRRQYLVMLPSGGAYAKVLWLPSRPSAVTKSNACQLESIVLVCLVIPLDHPSVV